MLKDIGFHTGVMNKFITLLSAFIQNGKVVNRNAFLLPTLQFARRGLLRKMTNTCLVKHKMSEWVDILSISDDCHNH